MTENPSGQDVVGYVHGDAAYVVEATGELDLQLEPQLRDELERALESGRPRLVVDLTAVGFLDSSALGRLVEAAKRLAERDGYVVLAAPDRQIRRLLEITALDRVFAIASSLDEALGTAFSSARDG